MWWLKMALMYFIERWIVLLWKWILFWKSGNMIRTLCFVRFHGNGPVKRSCTYTYIHTWLVYIHSWGKWVVLLCFGSLILIIKVVNYIIRTWLKNIHWTRLLWNSFMNGLIWIYKVVWMMVWWLYMFTCIYVVGEYICLCAYMLLVFIYVMCIYVVGEFFLHVIGVEIVGVSMYWNILLLSKS